MEAVARQSAQDAMALLSHPLHGEVCNKSCERIVVLIDPRPSLVFSFLIEDSDSMSRFQREDMVRMAPYIHPGDVANAQNLSNELEQGKRSNSSEPSLGFIITRVLIYQGL